VDTQVFITQYNINNNYCPESSQEPKHPHSYSHNTVVRERQDKVEELHNKIEICYVLIFRDRKLSQL